MARLKVVAFFPGDAPAVLRLNGERQAGLLSGQVWEDNLRPGTYEVVVSSAEGSDRKTITLGAGRVQEVTLEVSLPQPEPIVPVLVPDSPEHKEVREFELADGVTIEMIYVAPGTFWMGSPEGESIETDERRHQVTLTKGYWLSKTEVTQAQWKAVMGNNPSKFTGDQRPVETVSWLDVEAFVTALNKKKRGWAGVPTTHRGGMGVCLPGWDGRTLCRGFGCNGLVWQKLGI